MRNMLILAGMVVVLVLGPAAHGFRFAEEFDGQTQANNWAAGDNAGPDFPLGWQLPNGDEFAAGVGARADGDFGGDEAGRLRVLASSSLDMIGALDFTPVRVGTLDIGRMIDGLACCGGSSMFVRLLDGSGTVGVEILVQGGVGDANLANLSQANAGTFVADGDGMNWFSGSGTSLVVDFDAASDTFTALVTDFNSGDTISLPATAFDNAVGSISRLELVVPFGNPGANGTEVNMTHVILTPEPASLALLGLGGLMMLRRRR